MNFIQLEHNLICFLLSLVVLITLFPFKMNKNSNILLNEYSVIKMTLLTKCMIILINRFFYIKQKMCTILIDLFIVYYIK